METRSQVEVGQTVRLWDANTGNPLRTLTGHTFGVSSVSFSPDGNTLASGSRDAPCVCGMRPPAVRCARSQGIRLGSSACRFHPMATRSQVQVRDKPCVCGMPPPAVRSAHSQGIRIGSKRVVFTRWQHARKCRWGRHRASVGCHHRQSAAHAHRAYVLGLTACRFHPMATRSQVQVGTTPCVCGMPPPAVRFAHSQGIRLRSTACRFHPMATRSQVEVGTTPCVCGMRPPAVRCARSRGIRLGS